MVRAQRYTLTVIPRLPGQTASFATGLNDAGQVVGYSGSVAWLWDGNTLTNLDPGQGFSFAQGINDTGQVVGYAVLTAGAACYHAVVWKWPGRRPISVLSLRGAAAKGLPSMPPAKWRAGRRPKRTNTRRAPCGTARRRPTSVHSVPPPTC